MLPKSRQLREKRIQANASHAQQFYQLMLRLIQLHKILPTTEKEKCSIKRAGNNHSDLISLMPIYRKEICSIKRAQYNNIQLGNI
jgi:hypothetical protein